VHQTPLQRNALDAHAQTKGQHRKYAPDGRTKMVEELRDSRMVIDAVGMSKTELIE
jgi:hypothetical protein